ncbi:hypothetical protein V9L05_18945 [Bernardetia sp. Wsw4-3y2]|uniref:hypothetical protein n=1 Tax=Bernardetia sp. Wsw4-3y2 TaxID=3127471 RepID=UPI0030CF534A
MQMIAQQESVVNYENILQNGDKERLARLADCSPQYVGRIARKLHSDENYEARTLTQVKVVLLLELTKKHYEALLEAVSTVSFNIPTYKSVS